jgi:hypothetical protein
MEGVVMEMGTRGMGAEETESKEGLAALREEMDKLHAANAAEREHGLNMVASAIPKVLERTEAWDKIWTLSLGAGNAAGLVAMGAAAVNVLGKANPPDFWLVLLPPLWFFALGCMAAAAMPWARLRQQQHFHNYLNQWKDALTRHILYVEPQPRTFATAERLLGRAAACLFISGVFWPLTVVTFFSHR